MGLLYIGVRYPILSIGSLVLRTDVPLAGVDLGAGDVKEGGGEELADGESEDDGCGLHEFVEHGCCG